MVTNRPPPKVLFVQHSGPLLDGHVQYLSELGLRVANVDAQVAVARALEFQPDIIVLDFDAADDIISRLKHDDATKHIPIIALADAPKTSDDGPA